MKGMEQRSIGIHPAASLFPMLDDSELGELAADIKNNGLIEPIVLHNEMILDGRNRFEACGRAGVEPRFTKWEGASPTLFVLSKNLRRRHLTVGQKSAIAANMIPFLQKEAEKREGASTRYGAVSNETAPDYKELKGRSREIAADAVGVSHGSVSRAYQVMRNDPEEFKKIESGETNVNRAWEKVAKPKAEPSKFTKTYRIEQMRELAGSGHRASQIAANLGMSVGSVRSLASEQNIQLPDRLLRERRPDPNRIVRATVEAAENSVAGLELLDGVLDLLDHTELASWTASLSESIRTLSRLLRQLKQKENEWR